MSTATEELTAEQAEAALAALIAEAEPETETKPVKKAPAKKAAAPKPALFDLTSIPGVEVSKPRRAEETFSMLLSGVPKSGKTLLFGTASEVEALSPILLLALEDGSSVLARDYPDIDVIEPTDWTQAAAIITAVAEGKTKYKTIGVDTFGELQEMMKAHITNNGQNDMRIQDWGTIKDNSVNVVKMLHRSPVNSVFITHSEEIRDENTGAVRIQPVLLGKASLGEVPKVVDIIAYLAVAQDKATKSNFRVLQTGQDGKILAGDRFGKLDHQIINPTFGDIYEQLTSENGDTDADE
jgi:hypothetical protein